MTPEEVELIRADVALVEARADAFTEDFYATLFELDPTVRRLFESDMAAQRQKLFRELTALVELGLEVAENGVGAFNVRARALGARHRGYGVTPEHYATVEVALSAALERSLDEWSDANRRAWSRLYALVSDVMQSRTASST